MPTLPRLNELLRLFKKPGPIYVYLMETSMADILKARVLLPGIEDADVEKRHFSVSIDGGEAVKHELDKQLTFFDFDVLQDSFVHLELVDEDDAGNLSPARIRDFQALDTLPPPMPGMLNVEIIGEVQETPVVSEEPTPSSDPVSDSVIDPEVSPA